jgi:hypothetical protein
VGSLGAKKCSDWDYVKNDLPDKKEIRLPFTLSFKNSVKMIIPTKDDTDECGIQKQAEEEEFRLWHFLIVD